MNLIVRLVFISFVLCNVACSSEKENEPYFFSDSIDFRVSVSPQSRVTMQEDGSGGFQAGDEIAMWGYEAQPDRIQNKTVLRCEGNRWALLYIGKIGRVLLIFMRSGLLLLRWNCGRIYAGMCME